MWSLLASILALFLENLDKNIKTPQFQLNMFLVKNGVIVSNSRRLDL